MLLLENNRLRLSDRAQAKIRSILKQRGETDATVRLYAERTTDDDDDDDDGDGDGAIELGLAFDRRRDGDLTVPAEGVTVLADARTLAIARDRVIDYDTQGFTFAQDSACEARPFFE
jgi:Fe-S cluster assembly iron-binding protein IscA